MVVIRLARVGKKNSPAYRVVVADKQRAVKRKFIEVIGHYNPTLNPKELVIDKERAVFWMGQGAKASDTVNNLMADLGIIKKTDKVNKIYGKSTTKKAAKESGKDVASAASKEETPVEADAAGTEKDDTEAEPESVSEESVSAEPVETETATDAAEEK